MKRIDIHPGDRVAYAQHWLAATHNLTTGVGRIRGTVINVETDAPASSPRVVTILWDHAKEPFKALESNLVVKARPVELRGKVS